MNSFLSGKGSAYSKMVDCCTYELEVNSCLTNVTITYHDDSTATFVDTDAFASYVVDEMCIGCAEPTNGMFACGVRVYLDPLELPCNCLYANGNPPSYFGRTAKITAWGDGWNDTGWRTVIVSPGTVAVGTGFEVQLNELHQSNGGEGFDYSYGHSYSDDRHPMPLGSSALGQAVVAECNDLYCIWSIVVQDHFAPVQYARNVQNSQSVNWVNVPRQDTATIAEMEALWAALALRGFCSSAEIECIPASS